MSNAVPNPVMTLVSNLDRPDEGDRILGDEYKCYVQRFRTGTHPFGYQLTSVGVDLADEDLAAGTFRLHIYTPMSDGVIGDLVYTLIPPTSDTDGAVKIFTVPAGAEGVKLDSETQYYVVFEGGGDSADDFVLHNTRSDSGDWGDDPGWAIGNVWHLNGVPNASPRSFKISIQGRTRLPSDDASLGAISLEDFSTGDGIDIAPEFRPDVLSYTASAPSHVDMVTVNATLAQDGATVRRLFDGGNMSIAGGDTVEDGYLVALDLGSNTINIRTQAENGATERTYTLQVTRAAWPPDRKITFPERGVGHLNRPALVDRAMPTRRRLTVLKAPGGFGKSTLLAECCRRLRDEGVALAWITVDEHDQPAVLDTCIAYACQRAAAGNAAGAEPPATAVPSAIPEPGKGAAGHRTRLAVRDIAGVDGPFVVVFDELERLADPQSAALLDYLVRQGPPNLHLAFACRELPAGLDIAGAVLDGHAVMLLADDLRFSMAEVADFFRGRLSCAGLDALMTETAGWPIALRISLNNDMQGVKRLDANTAGELAKNWVESRLLAQLADGDRRFLLELSLFEWMDAALLDEALQRSDSARRIDAMADLVGLLEPVGEGNADVWRLHPLIREHCARRFFRESPARFRAVHRDIAKALARRGEVAAAMRHATQADEPARAGEILESAGGVRLWLREGEGGFLGAERWLREDIAVSRPRLALVRCLALILRGRLEDARKLYRSASQDFGDLRPGMSDVELEWAAENCVVRGTLALHGCVRIGSKMVQTEIAERTRLAESPRIDAVTRGYLEHGLCIARSMTACFGDALEHAARARKLAGGNTYMAMLADLAVGQVVMARGLPEEAAAHYHRARRTARETYVHDPVSPAVCEVLLRELALECNGGAALTGAAGRLSPNNTPFQPYAADCASAIELKLVHEGADAALETANGLLAGVHAEALPALARLVSALRVRVLAIAGRLDEAERAWSSDDLPTDAADCLDLEGQTWREMEAVSCARLRLMIERERFEEARAFAGELCTVTRARELKRTRMRAFALSVALESRAGDAAAASMRLQAYLRLYAETPYAGPLVSERSDCARVVAAYVGSSAGPGAKAIGRSLLEAIETADRSRQPVLSRRERQVLRWLDGRTDKRIAAELGLSRYGVRYHLRKLFTKLGTRDRREAVRRARQMGLIADDG